MSANRKRRTRAHIIADLSINFVERLVLKCGWTVQRFSPDYGLDLLMTTFSRRGEIENGDVRLQVRATDSIKMAGDQGMIAVRVEWRDMIYWLNEPLPVILVIYDAKLDRAWWIYLNESLRERDQTANRVVARPTIRIPIANVLDLDAVRRFRIFREKILARPGE